ISRFDREPGLDIGFGIFEGLQDHLFHLFICEAICRFYFDRLIFVRPLLLGRDAQNAVGVDEELHFDAGHSGWHWRDIPEIELRETAAILYHLAFPLKDMDLHVGLTIDESCK